MTRRELFIRAERCDRLAEVCRDPLVAEKLRQLSRDYWEMAGRLPQLPSAPAPAGCAPYDRRGAPPDQPARCVLCAPAFTGKTV